MRRPVHLLVAVAVAVLFLSTGEVIVTTASTEHSSLRSTSSTGVAARHDARSLRALNGFSQLSASWAAEIKRYVPGTAKYDAAKKARAEKAEALRTKKAVEAQKMRDSETAKVANEAEMVLRELLGHNDQKAMAKLIDDTGGFENFVVKLSEKPELCSELLLKPLAFHHQNILRVTELLVDATIYKSFEVRAAALKIAHMYKLFRAQL
ncbi:unnamed protein product [Hyaloperonospora brassicae]|uniref:RxLR effector candidate protein n=1 Tax=Hyaloperonospora brassicae TaxID=162125 RepID=A0AAV0T9L6_HYABA|nr:unnamed protein product [Hyaloperonospora brassicae]